MYFGKRLKSLFSDLPLRLVVLAASCYAIFFSAINIEKYRSFAFTDFDFAVNIQRYWNILHGEGRMSLIGDVTLWGNSLEVIAYPLSVVYFVLFSSPEALLILRALVFGVTAIPIFLIARRVLPGRWAACIAVSYLLNPALWYMNLYEYYDLTLCVLPLTLAFYYLKKDNFRLFVFFIVLSMMFRADIAMITFMYGIYALIDRKRLRWSVLPICLSVAWFVIGMLILRPTVYPSIAYEHYYSHLGGTFSDIARNVILNPMLPMKEFFSSQNALFALHLLLPVMFFSLFAVKELSICFLAVFQHLISLKSLEHTIYIHYAVTILPFVYISASYGLSKLVSRDKKALEKYRLLLPVMLLSAPLIANLWYGPLSMFGKFQELSRLEGSDAVREEFVRRVPKDASVITTFEFTSHMANRERLYSFHYVSRSTGPLPYRGYTIPRDIDYALVDFFDPEFFAFFYEENSDIRIRKFLEEGSWGVLDSCDTIVLFKKGYAQGPRLYRIGVPGFEGKRPIMQAGDKLALLDRRMNRQGQYLEMGFVWQCLDKMEDEAWLYFQALDSQGKEAYSKIIPLCYGIYPTKRWVKGETVADHYRILLPTKELKPGDYDVRVTLFSKASGMAIMVRPVGDADINDRFGLLLGSVRIP